MKRRDSEVEICVEDLGLLGIRLLVHLVERGLCRGCRGCSRVVGVGCGDSCCC